MATPYRDQFAFRLTAPVAVARAGEPVWVRGYGYANLEHGVPVGEDTVFRIGSVTKQFTAAAILLLAEEGRLSLDDTVEAYFPDFPPRRGHHDPPAASSTRRVFPTTPRATASWPIPRRCIMTGNACWPISQQLIRFTISNPARGWSYSNSGYILLDYIVEDAAGQPLADFLREQIFNPLGPQRYPHGRCRRRSSRAALRVRTRQRMRRQASPIPPISPCRWPPGRARCAPLRAIWRCGCRPCWMARWSPPQAWRSCWNRPGSMMAVLASYPPVAEIRLLSLPGTDYGLGIMTGERDGRRFIGHGGSINGFNASLIHYPDEATTIVLLVNTIGPAARGAPVLAGASAR